MRDLREAEAMPSVPGVRKKDIIYGLYIWIERVFLKIN